MVLTSFKTLFAVDMTCEDCVKSISDTLHAVPGIQSVTANLDDKLVEVSGTAAPSAIVSAIQSTGRDAILRGSGTANGAAVSILETHDPTVSDPVRGLARMVQVAPSMTVVDLTVKGVSPGTYHAMIREAGDISQGAKSTGGIWEALTKREKGRGRFGKIEVGKTGMGSVLLEQPVEIWELIGRSFFIAKQEHEGRIGENGPDILVGVIARSAGVWQNEKTVCACSGKTVWEERKDALSRGLV